MAVKYSAQVLIRVACVVTVELRFQSLLMNESDVGGRADCFYTNDFPSELSCSTLEIFLLGFDLFLQEITSQQHDFAFGSPPDANPKSAFLFAESQIERVTLGEVLTTFVAAKSVWVCDSLVQVVLL